MYEGAPDHPGKDGLWSICEQHGVTVFYTAPTAIRAFMKWGTELPARHDLSKLRLLGTVGEPINPEAWRSEEHTSELQSRLHLVCRLLLEKKKKKAQAQQRPHHRHR